MRVRNDFLFVIHDVQSEKVKLEEAAADASHHIVVMQSLQEDKQSLEQDLAAATEAITQLQQNNTQLEVTP